MHWSENFVTLTPPSPIIFRLNFYEHHSYEHHSDEHYRLSARDLRD